MIRRRSARRLIAPPLLAALSSAAVMLAFAAGASAVIVRAPDGRIAGVTPHADVRPSSLPGFGAVSARSGALNAAPIAGNLDYHQGPVLHSSAPYLIFWDPGNAIDPGSRALLTRYFTDVAADSSKATNVYAVDRQFTDGSGFADYRQHFDPTAQVINDTEPYPGTETGNCDAALPTCVSDIQLRGEIERLIAVRGLPSGIGTNAPIYFVVTPPSVNVCLNSTMCADNQLCAYHSSFNDVGSDVLYSPVPLLVLGAGQNPKACQADGNGAVQEPNIQLADVALKYLSHEDNETITDPLGTGWWDTSTQQEDGDNCNSTGASDFVHGHDPSAFLPTLGGAANQGTLFDQLINSDRYYIQSEWSNGDAGCRMRPNPSAVTASFTGPATVLANATGSFNPSASASAAPYSSVTWNFGDGSRTLFTAGASGPTQVSHTFTAPGSYAVTLTLVDQFGNLSTAGHFVLVPAPPVASFSASSSSTRPGLAVSFNGAPSTDPDASITSYRWSFGDGSVASGPATTHVYRALGPHTVTLTVRDSFGQTSSSSKQVLVDQPAAAFGVTTRAPVSGTPVSFNGSGSTDAVGAITRYTWLLGDRQTALGRTPRHTYRRPGFYTVTLTVQTSTGLTASVSHRITVGAVPISKLSVTRTRGATFVQVSVSGAGVLSVGSARKRVHRAGRVSVRLWLTRAAIATLHKRHRLKVRVKIKFITRAGASQGKSILVTFRG